MATMKQVYGKVPSLKNERFVNATPTVIVSETALRGPDGDKNPIESLSKLQSALTPATHTAGNSQLLIEYREALIKAYNLGIEIKELYGVVPPKAIHNEPDFSDARGKQSITIGLTVN
jgi:hypothetical protein